MTTAPTISPAPPDHLSLDVEALRGAGMAYIEQYASQRWTDYNRHDPGVTTLEMACYAITDVSLRASLPIRDLLTSALGSPAAVQADFADITAKKILTTSPVTELDYRKLFIDVPGVQNAWLLAAPRTVYADFGEPDDHQRLRYVPQSAPATPVPFVLNGLYDIRIAYDPAYLLAQTRPGEGSAPPAAPDEATAKQRVLAAVRSTYLAHRNLGEDLNSVAEIPAHGVMLCADVDIAPGVRVAEVYARMLLAIEQYLNPPVKRYSLAEMQAKPGADGQPLTTDQIFDGPALDHGFILDDELEKAALRETIYTSDLINLLLAIEINGQKAVRAVRKVRLNHCDATLATATGERWCLHVPAGHQPRLCVEKVALAFYKDIVPVGSDADKALAMTRLAQLRAEAAQAAERQAGDLPVPTGFAQPLTTYRSIANDFPQTYGIGPLGLPRTATAQRRAQAKQFKAYLLFFDQLLANYLQQLYQLGTLLSTRGAGAGSATFGRTYFGQPVTDMEGVADLWLTPGNVATDLQTVLDAEEDFATNPDRRSRLLDHLLARFAEDFGEYALLMRSVFGQNSADDVVADKARFLADYRFFVVPKAYDYTQPAWATDNVAGVVRRLARLAGMDEFQAHVASAITDTPANPDGGAEALFLLEHILLRPRTDATSPYWLSLCLNADGTFDEPLDPYTYRLSIVLPGYTARFSNVAFRRFFEKVIRLELPAHLLARICWVGRDQLADFETKYQAWLAARATLADAPETATYATSRKNLIDALEGLHTIYPPGTLHDCDNSDEENPLMLGRSALGSLPPS